MTVGDYGISVSVARLTLHIYLLDCLDGIFVDFGKGIFLNAGGNLWLFFIFYFLTLDLIETLVAALVILLLKRRWVARILRDARITTIFS